MRVNFSSKIKLFLHNKLSIQNFGIIFMKHKVCFKGLLKYFSKKFYYITYRKTNVNL